MNAYNSSFGDDANRLPDRQSASRLRKIEAISNSAYCKNSDVKAELNALSPDLLGLLHALMEENASLRDFAASAVHDIKAPLRGISLALDMMQEENFDADVVKETHAIAQKSALRLADLSNGLLELAAIRETEGRFVQTDLTKVIGDACSMLGTQIETARATVTSNVPYAINANGRLLLRLFLNLIGNALKYKDPKRTQLITIDVVRETPRYLEIAITDTGMGIAPKHAKNVFKPLIRLHSRDEIEGSGLGLAICSKIANVHGGSLRLDQDYNEGARFILRLPCFADATGFAAA